MSQTVRSRTVMLLWLIKAIQASQHLPGPDQGSAGWAPNTNRAQQIFIDSNLSWRDLPSATTAAARERYSSLWLTKAKTYTPHSFTWAAGQIRQTPGSTMAGLVLRELRREHDSAGSVLRRQLDSPQQRCGLGSDHFGRPITGISG